ncbi:Cof-type HAD-IIB family hydrolase [Weissella soli]|uniref:Cof-type HAD-IIB family hydrolase n=1 Tax=Weissella soli TaxID=155866 RepID=UPI0011BBB6B3|nr:Cof-type HAD-IIB family hydrolase [Weissella soli]QEA34551.1 HAD family phosphatase [Weissella soli]
MSRKLIGIDLDGTTLNEKSQVSERTRHILQAAQNEGHIISIITGRPARLSTDIYDTLGLKSPMINFNGALGHKPHQVWDREYSHQVSREIAFDLLEVAPDLNIERVVAENKDSVWASPGQVSSNLDEIEQMFFPTREAGQQMLDRLSLNTDINAILLEAASPLHQTQIKRFVMDRYGEDQVTVKTWGGESPVLEVAPAGISKTTGLDYLQHIYQIDKQDIFAFGDEMNDLEMIEWAEHGIVMANGNPDLKAVADDVTDLSNTEDGMARYIAKMLHMDVD